MDTRFFFVMHLPLNDEGLIVCLAVEMLGYLYKPICHPIVNVRSNYHT